MLFKKRTHKHRATYKRSKLQISRLILGLGFLVVLTVAAMGFLFKPNEAEANWFDDAWLYRSPVVITNGSGGVLTDFQVKITVDSDTLYTASKVQADCDDLRFADVTGNLLPYWIEDTASASEAITCNAADIDVWVKVPTLATTGSTIYMYYGNTNATAVSNGKDTFNYFEPFTSLDTSIWTATGGSSVTSGELTVTTGALYSNSTIMAGSQGYVYEARVKWDSATGTQSGFGMAEAQVVVPTNATSIALGTLSVSGVSANVTALGADSTTNSFNIVSNSTQYTIVAATYKVIGFSLDSTNFRTYDNRVQANSYAGTWNLPPYVILGDYRGSGADSSYDAKDTTVDWIIVRKYASSVPTAATGTEEKGLAPISYWSFDEGLGTAANDSIKGHNGTLTNGPSWRDESDCISGKCLYFDGVDDYVNIGNISTYKVATKTLSYWAKPSGLPSTLAIIMSNQGASYYAGFNSNGRMFTSHQSSAPAQITTSSNNNQIISDEWHLYSFVFDVSGSNVDIHMYMDGNLVKTTNYTSGMSNTYGTNFLIGAFSTASYYFKGFIDEVKIYNYARTAAQIKQEFNSKGAKAGSAIEIGDGGLASGLNLNDNLVAYYPMNETAANSCSGGANDNCDKSGNSNDGAWNGDATSIVGKYGKGVTLDGTGDYIQMNETTSLDFNKSKGTVGMWIKATDFSNGLQQVLFDASGDSITMALQADGDLYFYPNTANGGGFNYNLVTNPLIDGQWNHVAATWDLSTKSVRIFVNGIERSLAENLVPANWTSAANTTNFYIGSRYNQAVSNFFNGQVDETRLYSRVLSPAEIRALSNWAAGPAAYWGLNENTSTTAYDSAGNGSNLSLTSPNWNPGKYGSALKLSSSVADAAIITDNAYISLTTSGTVSAWVNSDRQYPSDSGSTVFRNIVNKWASGGCGGGDEGYFFDWNGTNASGSLRGSVCNGTTNQSITYTTALNPGEWYHVAFSWDGSYLRLYMNGVQVSAIAQTVQLQDDTSTLRIGDGFGGGSATYRWEGLIDEVKIYDYARTTSQVFEDMNNGSMAGIGEAYPIMHYAFEEGTGTATRNAVSSSDGGTLTSMAAPATATSGWTSSGKIGRGLAFDGSNDHVLVADSVNTSFTGPMSISAWVNRTTASTADGIVGKYVGSSNRRSYLLGMNTSVVNFILSSNGTSATTLQGVTTITAGRWYHIVATYDGSFMRIYVNGSLENSVAYSSGIYNSTDPLKIGDGDSTFWPFVGKIDEVKLYNFGLTAEQVILEYNQGRSVSFGGISTASDGLTADSSAARQYCVPGDTATCNAPVLDLSFDEGTGTAAYDVSGNVNTGTLTSGPTWGSGKFGNAVLLDGSDDYVDIGNVSGHTNFTYSFWFKTTSASTYQAIFQTDDMFFQITSGGSYNYSAWNGRAGTGASKANTAGTVVADTWQHAVVTATGSTTLSFYLNGVLVSSTSSADTPSFAYSDDRIGSLINTVPSASRFFSGAIDNFRVYDHVRTPAQIAWEYNQGAPMFLYRLDECEGSTAYNSAKNANGDALGNNATITIGATGTNTAIGTCSGSAGQAWKDGATGKYAASIELDGTDDKVDTAVLSDLNLTGRSFTIATWIKTTQAVLATPLMIRDANGIAANVLGGFPINITAGKVSFDTWDYAANRVTSRTTINDGQWHHVVGTYNSTTGLASLYVDGKLEGTDTQVGSSGNVSKMLRLGGNINTAAALIQIYAGQVDDAQVYFYDLTAAQVRDLYNRGAVSFN